MSRTDLTLELKDWLGDDERREALMIQEAPIGKSTLKAVKSGRYNPGPRLERAIRDVMKKHTSARKIPAAG